MILIFVGSSAASVIVAGTVVAPTVVFKVTVVSSTVTGSRDSLAVRVMTTLRSISG